MFLLGITSKGRTPSTPIWSSRLYKFIQDGKSTLLVDPAGQKPNTLNPHLVKQEIRLTYLSRSPKNKTGMHSAPRLQCKSV